MTRILDSYELSPLQAGMLYHAAAAAQPGVDIEQVVLTLHEPLDEAAFLRAWDRVVERHAVLRTRFRWQGVERPLQEVVDRARIPVERFDGRLEKVLQEHRTRGFDLTQAPLMRLALGPHTVVWTVHHILLDGRSRVLLWEEVFAWYEAFAGGRDLEVPQPRPFRDYIDWLGRLDHQRAQPHWQRALAGFLAPTPLVVARDSGGSGNGRRECRLPATLTTALRKRARAAHLTLGVLLQGAWALLLHRYSGESDVVFGVTRAVRPPALDGAGVMLGLLINTLPLRIRVDPEAELLPWLESLREPLRVLRDYEHTPLAAVHGWSEVPRGAALFESLFVFAEQTFDAQMRAQGGAWSGRRFENFSQTNYPLALAAYGDEQLVLQLQYSRRRFADDVIERMSGHLETLLEGMAGDPHARLRDLPLLTADENYQVVNAWNATAVAYPRARCAHELFEEQARTRPDALALEDSRSQVSYRELDERAEMLASRLRRHGVQPDSLVAVYLERSIEMVVALLAVWKAGAAYVPVDREYPAERVRFMLEDTGASVVLTQKTLAADLPPSCAVLVEVEADEAPGPFSEKRVLTPFPDRVAYVIYTSGSTGVPKGVPITHRSLFNLISWHQSAYEVVPADRATQVAGPAFDATVWELWPYLAAGASVHIPDQRTRLDAGRLVRWLAERRITLAFLPTPLAEAALREPWPEHSGLRVLLTGGDKLSRGADLPFRLVNHYGPTENTVVSTCADVPARGIPPIGRPLPNTHAYIVDRYLQPVPIGVPGELLVGGVQLTAGYWKRSSEQFIQAFGKRLYRTGDLVRWWPDGNIEFVGRIDDQVKIRGFRIEPGEVEAVIRRHSGVREVVVLAREVAGDKRLVAYVVTDSNPEELRTDLRAKLPSYMVPAHFVRLAALPLSENGKIDRRALLQMSLAEEPRDGTIAPRTQLEQSLARIWGEVLGIERVSVEDDFFALGGHSLLAMQVVSRLRQALGVELPLQELFAAPTIAGLARSIESIGVEPATAPQLLAARGGADELSFSQQRLWFLDQLQPGATAYVIPAAIEISGPVDLRALERALAALVSRHESLRTTFVSVGGRPLQVISEPGAWTLPLTDGRENIAPLLREEACRPFNLARGPLFRARLYRLAPDRHVLLLVLHHIIADGWSMGILARELGALYRRAPSRLPPPRLQYRDYARWQRESLKDAALQALLAHWRSRLAGAPQVLALPTDRPRPAVESNRGALYSFLIPSGLTDELRALGRREGATLFMTLLAGFAQLLARYSGQHDFLVGTPVANRNRPELEDVIGCFVNIVLLRVDVTGAPSVSELIARLRAVCLDAFAHQDLPFDRLVEELQPARDLGRNPLFQVMFALHNAPERPLKLGALGVRTLEVDPGAAKVDLSLQLQETPQGLSASFEYATDLFGETTIARMAAHWRVLLEEMVAAPDRSVGELALLTAPERQALAAWNATAAPCPAGGCVHWQIEAQAERTPRSIALVFEDQALSYRDLNVRANRLAARLIGLGIGPDRLVGVHLSRSIEMVVALLAVLKAGGAYVPLDPGFPAERLRYMVDDSGLGVVLTQRNLPQVFAVKTLFVEDLDVEAGNPATAATGANLAYVVYTSGSTGRPKGVMVEHRNVTNFFAGMDARLRQDEPGTWLALTSLSFDISVLELLWTLARGYKVVIQGELEDYFVAETAARPVGLSLFMWGNDDAPGRDKYRLMLEGAKYFDRNGFEAVWTPERHFHAFGGPYPNPSVTGAALAAVTERIAIRAGSCVSPLHHPIRIAEEWAVVDNLSNGRVALAFASGWNPNDFIVRPENHAEAKAIMLEQIDQVRRLWRGEQLEFRNPSGQWVPIRTLPRPVQPELPFWVTTAGNPETYRQAGELGANVLTHLLGQTLEEVAEKIAVYRRARAAAGHDPATGRVTLMLHTFVGADDAEVRELVREPMKEYLRASLKLTGLEGAAESRLDQAFERYFETSGLFGTPATGARMAERCRRAGVDEIACLLDFGVPTEQVLASLPDLNQVREMTSRQRVSIARNIERHGVTHVQCTPSLARMLLADAPARAALAGIRHLLVGGEALPAALARELKSAIGGELTNMYGPTETTVWSAMHPVEPADDPVPIGRPIANTQISIVDGFGQPLPAGVPGELVIGGAGVARGYLNRPELTAERFINGSYRTGDVARFMADGRIEYLGRADGQVKIRGYRVELGEIESVLSGQVGQAAVSVHDSNLVAYVVGEADFAKLRAYLRAKLPDYMVPSEFVRLDRMPYTPNGKLDRKALPAPERSAAAAEFVAPATLTERALAELWQRVLRIERIGAKDNFFESGGHSLLAMQLVVGVRERLGVELPLRNLFEHPVLADLAEAIDALAWLERSKAPPARAEREETLL